jgi:hypothetical protein
MSRSTRGEVSSEARTLLALAAVAIAGGVTFSVLIPRAGVTRQTLLDAGFESAQRVVVVCEERLGKGAVKRLRREFGANAMRARQRYAEVARVGLCARSQGVGNCLRPDGGVFAAVTGGDIVVPSLRFLARLEDGEDESEDGDIVASYLLHGTCRVEPCQDFGALCTDAFAFKLTSQRCALPRCRNDAGDWDESVEPDCRLRLDDGGTRWNGCNVIPRAKAVGTECMPSSCTVVSGEGSEWL